jgi:hypothetical protein
VPIRTRRPIRIEGCIVYVELTRGFIAVIDAADVHLVADYCWRVQVRRHTSYAVTSVCVDGRYVELAMHRLLTAAPAGLDVDHSDRDGLNNRRGNLRVCSRSENLRNSRRRQRQSDLAKGVKNCGGVYRARIFIGSRELHLGTFDTAAEAAAAYLGAAVVVAGEFARQD